MTRIKLAIATVLSLAFTPLAAQDLRGWCFPAEECMGVQIPIGSGTYGACDSSCTLTNPVAIRDMEATLYDEVCEGDWGSNSIRTMFVSQSYGERMFAIDDFSIIELERCRK